jgi:PHD/YefM family antitoxin component YafN of YafNO toxin-antitoxin module
MFKVPEIVQTSDLRKNLSFYLEKAEKEPVIITTSGDDESKVLLGSRLYNALVQAYEDYADAQFLAKRIKEDEGDHATLAEMKETYGA